MPKGRKLNLPQIEELEYRHFERIRYFVLDNINSIINGLNSRLNIKGDWYEQFIASKSNKASDLESGAERIFHHIFAHGMKNPNSAPIGADLMFETYDAFIHIDVKTISDSNWSDYKGKLVVEPNQTSYPIDYMGVKTNLPPFYSKTFSKNRISHYKPCLTYFIYVLHQHASDRIYSILLICMPNGFLYCYYGNKIIQAGKSKGKNVRFAFKNCPIFELISNKYSPKYRVEFLWKDKAYSQEDLTGIKEKKLKIPVWIEQ